MDEHNSTVLAAWVTRPSRRAQVGAVGSCRVAGGRYTIAMVSIILVFFPVKKLLYVVAPSIGGCLVGEKIRILVL